VSESGRITAGTAAASFAGIAPAASWNFGAKARQPSPIALNVLAPFFPAAAASDPCALAASWGTIMKCRCAATQPFAVFVLALIELCRCVIIAIT
jgi:hypothetical protein